MYINEIIDSFLDEDWKKYKNRISSDKKAVENLLKGNSTSSLLSIYGNEEFAPDAFACSIAESVKAYSSVKDSAINIYKIFVSYIESKMNVKIDICFPPIPISNTFERLMFISKYLQNESNLISDIEDILWIGNRTVEEDLNVLRGNKDPIQICGRQFVIDDTTRRYGRLQFASTVHPFFLTCNITQVIVTLKGLKQMSENPLYKSYAISTARAMWEQLSDYAKNRIFYVCENILVDELEWYKKLDTDTKRNNSFYSESYCSTIGDNVVCECMKAGESCCIEYNTDDKSEFYTDCKVLKYVDNGFVIKYKDEELTLERDRILRSAYTKDQLI